MTGEDLGKLLAATRASDESMPLECALTIAVGLCEAVHRAHELAVQGSKRPVVHGTVAPANVVIGLDGAVTLVGEASTRDATGELAKSVGGPYGAPEQSSRRVVFDRRSDVFSIGAVMYELTTGQLPFGAGAGAKAGRDATRPSLLVPGYPLALEAIVMRTLVRDPDRRFPTAHELQLQLESYARERRMRLLPQAVAQLMTKTFPGRRAGFVEPHAARTQAGEKMGDSIPSHVPHPLPQFDDSDVVAIDQSGTSTDVVSLRSIDTSTDVVSLDDGGTSTDVVSLDRIGLGGPSTPAGPRPTGAPGAGARTAARAAPMMSIPDVPLRPTAAMAPVRTQPVAAGRESGSATSAAAAPVSGLAAAGREAGMAASPAATSASGRAMRSTLPGVRTPVGSSPALMADGSPTQRAATELVAGLSTVPVGSSPGLDARGARGSASGGLASTLQIDEPTMQISSLSSVSPQAADGWMPQMTNGSAGPAMDPAEFLPAMASQQAARSSSPAMTASAGAELAMGSEPPGGRYGSSHPPVQLASQPPSSRPGSIPGSFPGSSPSVTLPPDAANPRGRAASQPSVNQDPPAFAPATPGSRASSPMPVPNHPGAVPIVMPPMVPSGGTLVSSATLAGKLPPSAHGPSSLSGGLVGLAGQSMQNFAAQHGPGYAGGQVPPGFASPAPAAPLGYGGPAQTIPGMGPAGPAYGEAPAPVPTPSVAARPTLMLHRGRSRWPLIMGALVALAGAAGGVWFFVLRPQGESAAEAAPSNAPAAGATGRSVKHMKSDDAPDSKPGAAAEAAPPAPAADPAAGSADSAPTAAAAAPSSTDNPADTASANTATAGSAPPSANAGSGANAGTDGASAANHAGAGEGGVNNGGAPGGSAPAAGGANNAGAPGGPAPAAGGANNAGAARSEGSAANAGAAAPSAGTAGTGAVDRSPSRGAPPSDSANTAAASPDLGAKPGSKDSRPKKPRVKRRKESKEAKDQPWNDDSPFLPKH